MSSSDSRPQLRSVFRDSESRKRTAPPSKRARVPPMHSSSRSPASTTTSASLHSVDSYGRSQPGPIATHFGAQTREVTARILQSDGPYSSFYGNAERASEREFQRGTRPPELVARVIVGAIESRRPKARYRVAPMAKILVPLKGLASDRFLDRRLKRALKLPDSI